MNSLVTRLLWVPTITKGDSIAVENSAMVASHGRGRSGCGTRGMLRNGRGGREYQEFLRLKSNNHVQSSASPSVSTAYISHSMGSQGPCIVGSIASDHIFGNDSMFSSISLPKFPHFISLANGSKMDWNTSQLIGEGHESRGLYYLKNSPSMSCFASVSPKLLHNRLGYPSLAKLKYLGTKPSESCDSASSGLRTGWIGLLATRFSKTLTNTNTYFPLSFSRTSTYGLSVEFTLTYYATKDINMERKAPTKTPSEALPPHSCKIASNQLQHSECHMPKFTDVKDN
ncbi:hypothetical protein CR513_50287, partial [Mucuna pruriens]